MKTLLIAITMFLAGMAIGWILCYLKDQQDMNEMFGLYEDCIQDYKRLLELSTKRIKECARIINELQVKNPPKTTLIKKSVGKPIENPAPDGWTEIDFGGDW